jgi:general secretion pathway protein B
MSYILNALKNSENQRNRGEIPHIDSQPEFVKALSGRFGERAWKWAALLAVAALLLSLGWAHFGGGKSVISEPLPAKPSPAELAVPAPHPAKPPPAELAAPAPLPAKPPPAELATPAPAPQLPTVSPVVEPLERAPGLPALQDMAGVRIRVEEGTPPGAGTASTSPSAVPPSPRVVLEMPVSGGVIPRETAPLQPSPGARAAGEAPPAEVLSGVSHWKTLPANIQKQLREMAFTVHIYSATPPARFIRVSGRTLHEGEQLNGELQLQQITRDGIVFTYHGGKFWIGMN